MCFAHSVERVRRRTFGAYEKRARSGGGNRFGRRRGRLFGSLIGGDEETSSGWGSCCLSSPALGVFVSPTLHAACGGMRSDLKKRLQRRRYVEKKRDGQRFARSQPPRLRRAVRQSLTTSLLMRKRGIGSIRVPDGPIVQVNPSTRRPFGVSFPCSAAHRWVEYRGCGASAAHPTRKASASSVRRCKVRQRTGRSLISRRLMLLNNFLAGMLHSCAILNLAAATISIPDCLASTQLHPIEFPQFRHL